MKFILHQTSVTGKFFGAKVPKEAWVGIAIEENGVISVVHTYGHEYEYPEEEVQVSINFFRSFGMYWEPVIISESDAEFITDKVASTTSESLLFPHFAGGFSPKEKEDRIHSYFDQNKRHVDEVV